MHYSRMRTARSSGHLSCHAPPATHAPCHAPPPPVDRQTPVKTKPSQTSFAGGKNLIYVCSFVWCEG